MTIGCAIVVLNVWNVAISINMRDLAVISAIFTFLFSVLIFWALIHGGLRFRMCNISKKQCVDYQISILKQ